MGVSPYQVRPTTVHRPVRRARRRHARPSRTGPVLRPALCVAGGFLLALALLVPLLIYPRVARLETDPQRQQVLVGSDATVLLPDPAAAGGARTLHHADVRITTFTSRATDITGGDDDVVWDLATDTEVPGVGLVDAHVERVSLDARTSEPVNCCGDRLVTNPARPDGEPVTHRGYVSFPLDTRKHAYRLWDVALRTTRTADFAGEQTLQGVGVYKFETTVPLHAVGTARLPGTLFGLGGGSVTATSLYGSDRTYWIEPNTGAVVDMREQLTREYRYGGRVVTAMDATLTQVPDAGYAREYRRRAVVLRWLRWLASVPLTVLGLLFLAVALPPRRRKR